MSQILPSIARSMFRKEAISKYCHMNISNFSRIINGRKIPTKYEKILLRNGFTELKIMSERELLDALAENEQALEAGTSGKHNRRAKKR